MRPWYLPYIYKVYTSMYFKSKTRCIAPSRVPHTSLILCMYHRIDLKNHQKSLLASLCGCQGAPRGSGALGAGDRPGGRWLFRVIARRRAAASMSP